MSAGQDPGSAHPNYLGNVFKFEDDNPPEKNVSNSPVRIKMALAQGIHVPFVAGAIPKLLDQGFGIQDAVK